MAQAVKPQGANSLQALIARLRGAQEAELFGPRGRLPRRGEPDTAKNTALLVLGGLILGGLILRLIVTRGVWLDEAISIHQAHLSLHGMFRNLYYGDRVPPLYDLVLWVTVRIFGNSEFAVRLPSLIAGTLVIPVLYELGRELYDRRTGLIAAGFAALSPLLVWYAQEVRMYSFVVLFGLLALLTQLRVIRNGTTGNWAAYILSTAALLWSNYFGLLVIAVQQLIFIGVLLQMRRNSEPVRPLLLGVLYSAAILLMQLVPLIVFAHNQYHYTHAAAGSPSGTYDPLSFYTLLANVAWGLWGYQPDTITILLAALWPFVILISLLLLGRGGSRQTLILAVAAAVPVVLLLIVSLFDRSLWEVRYFLLAVPLLLLLIARLITGWIRRPSARWLAAGLAAFTLFLGLIDQQANNSNPRLFDFRGAINDIKANASSSAVVLFEPGDMRYVLEYYAPNLHRQPLNAPITAASEGSPLFVIASFQKNKQFFNDTNRVVGQLGYFRTQVAQFTTPQTKVWEFR
ncbi:MAG: glycosyltransferase family 39 protein [Solirubrobacterales bacterium]|nr:glycosyltransferase family 39 protein [Solirubrobacterales bacterium]